jgi:hypothetical protein
VLALGLGALRATLFQRASCFSRARHHRQRTDSMTVEELLTWSSHLVRRAISTLLLPFAGVGYALASRGPAVPAAVSVTFAAGVGFLSNLAIAECLGIIMEAFDTSDPPPASWGDQQVERQFGSGNCAQIFHVKPESVLDSLSVRV